MCLDKQEIVNVFLDKESIKIVTDIIKATAKVILRNSTRSSNNFAFFIIQINGINHEMILGDTKSALENQAVLERCIKIARWKIEKTIKTGFSTGEILRNHPELYVESDYLFAGSAIDVPSGIVAAMSSAKGLSDEGLAETAILWLKKLAALNRDNYMNSDKFSKNSGQIIL